MARAPRTVAMEKENDYLHAENQRLKQELREKNLENKDLHGRVKHLGAFETGLREQLEAGRQVQVRARLHTGRQAVFCRTNPQCAPCVGAYPEPL